MNDYDFEKMAEGGVSFENLTGRLQKLAESFASAMYDVSTAEVLYNDSPASADNLLDEMSPQEIADNLQELKGDVGVSPAVTDYNGSVSLEMGSWDGFDVIVKWGPQQINNIFAMVEKSVREEIRDGALSEDVFEDAVKNMIALTMSDLIGMVGSENDFDAKNNIDDLAEEVGQRLYVDCDRNLRGAASNAMDRILAEGRYSVSSFVNGVDARDGGVENLVKKYQNGHPDLVTAFFDEFEDASLFDLQEFSETEVGRSWKSTVNKLENKAWDFGLERLSEEIEKAIEG